MLIRRCIIFLSILINLVAGNIYGDWTTASVVDIINGALCADPSSYHPSLVSKVVTKNFPLTSDPNDGWFTSSSDLAAYNGKILMLNWNFSGVASPTKYKMLYTAYGTKQSLYIAQMGNDGKYKWIGTVPGQTSSTANGFLAQYQHSLPINVNNVLHLKTISRADFLKDGSVSNWNASSQLTPYSSTNPAIGNGFYSGTLFDNLLVKTQTIVPSSISYPSCNLSNINNPSDCVFKNGSGVAIKADASANNKTETQTLVLHNSNYMFQFEPLSNANLSILYPNLIGASFGLYGHYFFQAERGTTGSIYDTGSQQLLYKICPGSSYCTNASVITVTDKNYKANAYANGKIWLKIQDTSSATLSGVGSIKVQAYNGTTQYSDFIYNNIISQMQTQLLDASRILYENAIINPATKKIYTSLMTLYLMLYGMYFLLGMVEIKLHDLISRTIKIVVLSQVFSENSWNFFNTYFFSVFTGGLTYLIYSISGVTSSATNIFGFIDPFMAKISNDQFWAALAGQIASIHNGLTVIGILVLVGVFLFLLGAFEIILTYLISIMGLSVMICMAPLFMVMVLFSKTKPLFDNWVSMLFVNAIQPTITLLLFLVVAQFFETYASRSVLSACMGTYIPIQLNLDFSWINDDWNIKVSLPFFPGIPFLIPGGNSSPDLFTSAILTYVFGKVGWNLSDFSMSIAGALTSIQSGAGQMAASVKKDAMGKPV